MSPKRVLDLVGSVTALVVLSPVLVVIGWKIRSDGGPAFYRGARVGFAGEVFDIFKFRTMVANAEKVGGSSTADDDPRITHVGRLLRRYKLDELPQLLNVVKGEMSLVGPRPQVASDVALYTQAEKRLLSVSPGITDYASILFRDEGGILEGGIRS